MEGKIYSHFGKFAERAKSVFPIKRVNRRSDDCSVCITLRLRHYLCVMSLFCLSFGGA